MRHALISLETRDEKEIQHLAPKVNHQLMCGCGARVI